MRRYLLVIPLLVGLFAWAGPVPAQHPAIGLNAAQGCDVFVGQGAGQILTPADQFPMIDVGTVAVGELSGERAYTLVWEAASFPPAAAGAEGPFEYRGVGSWRMLENGVQGTNRYRMVLTLDPAAPGMADFVLHGEVFRGNRYETGSSYLQGRANLLTGAYTVDFYAIALCQP
ncbi:MAG TPA: hypothetical protein VLA75_12370 [Thermoanaerobaculia bacterium]|nr:hypothetical protein [Thermoanaerobaculia bacterium]